MKAIIEQLRTLNDLDVRLQAIARDLARLPQEVAGASDELRQAQDKIERQKAEVMRLRAEADALDLELKSGLETLRRLANQMNILRTSKEFEVIKRQMDAQRVWNSQVEDKALALMTQADDKHNEATQLIAQAEQTQTELDALRQRVEAEMAGLREEQERLATVRQELAKEVPDKELATYDRIVVNRGQAIAGVKSGGYCSACHMKLPPQIHNLALLAQNLVTCPNCGRILTASLPKESEKPELP